MRVTIGEIIPAIDLLTIYYLISMGNIIFLYIYFKHRESHPRNFVSVKLVVGIIVVRHS